MIEHAILEVACERKAYNLRNLINNKGQQTQVCCVLANQFQITVDDFQFILLRNSIK